MISLSRCVGVWLTALWTDRRITDRASFTKMKMMEIWGSSLAYFSSLHLRERGGRVGSEEGGRRGHWDRRMDTSSQGVSHWLPVGPSWLKPKKEIVKGSGPDSPKFTWSHFGAHLPDFPLRAPTSPCLEPPLLSPKQCPCPHLPGANASVPQLAGPWSRWTPRGCFTPAPRGPQRD